MPLTATIEEEYKKAFRGGEKTAIDVLRLLKTGLHNALIEKRGKTGNPAVELTEEEAVGVVKRQVKQLEESGELFQKGGRPDLKTKNDAELTVLKQYLPAPASEEEVREVVQTVMARMGSVGPGDFGKVMGAAMKALGGKADGTLVSRVVKEMLAKNQ